MRARRTRPARLVPAAALLALACATDPPVVEQHVERLVPGALRKVAVAPFVPREDFPVAETPTAVSGGAAAALVSRFVSEALEEQGIEAVAPSDLVMAFEARGLAVPRQDPVALARLAAAQFGASAVLLGRVGRYRERSGEALGTLQPASVRFELALYAAPSGEPLWRGRFDETQVALSENVFRARRYPGAGTRWLSAAELARWGARTAVDGLPEGLR